MRFLSVSDRKEAALVCRAWYEASLDPILQHDIIIHFYASSAASTGKAIPSLSKRRLPHLILSDFDSSLDEKAVVLKSCEHMGNNLKSLSLKGSNITERTFVELLSHCKSLVSLDLSCCNSLFMSGTLLEMNSDLHLLKDSLTNVLDVNLSSIRHISDVTFNRIVTVCENVEKLSLASVQIAFSDSFFKQRSASRFANSSVLTFKNIMDFVITQYGLKSLNFSKTQLEDEHLEELVSTPDLNLHELILTGCRNVSDDGIGAVCKHQPGLFSLDIRECPDLTNCSLMAISHNLKQLKNLYMNKCKQISDKAVATTSKLHMLQKLDLSDCHLVSCKGLISGLCIEDFASPITHLNLSCTDAGDEFVEKACVNLPQLNHIDLGSCFRITDKSVHAITKSMKYLRYLRLAWCSKVTDSGLLGLNPDPNRMTTDNEVTKCNSKVIFKKPVERKTLENLTSTLSISNKPVALHNLAGLRYLDLTACKKLTDTGLSQAVKFSELRFLGLGMLEHMTDDGLTQIVFKNPSTEDLNISQCKNITDVAMETVTRFLPRLQTLNVMGCGHLTDKSVMYMKRSCGRLRHLDVSFCGGITYTAIDQLETANNTLVSVQKRGISYDN